MSRTRRVVGGLTFGYLNVAVVTLVGLWLTTFLLTHLGERDYGLWLVVAQVLAYLMLADLGIVALLPREIAYATGRAGGADRAADLGAIASQTLGIVVWQLPVVAAAAGAVLLFLPADWAPLRTPLAIVLAAFVVAFPFRILHALLRGLQDLAYLSVSQTIAWGLATVTSVILVLRGAGLTGLAIGWVVGQVASALLWGTRLRRRFPSALPQAFPRLRWRAVRAHLTRGGWVSMSQIAQVLVAGTDLLIIGRVIGPAAVVLYFCTSKVIAVLGNQPQMLMDAAQPGLSELRTGAGRDRLLAVCTALSQGMLLLSGAVACVVLAVNDGFVTWWVGREYFGGLGLTAALVGVMLLRHWNVTAGYALFAFGRERRLALTALADGVVTVTAQVLLARWLGPIGVAVGAALGVALVSLPANLTALGQETGSLPRILAAPGPWAWRFAVVAAAATAAGLRWPATVLPALVAMTLAVGVAYAAIMSRFALRGELSVYLRPHFLKFWQPTAEPGAP